MDGDILTLERVTPKNPPREQETMGALSNYVVLAK